MFTHIPSRQTRLPFWAIFLPLVLTPCSAAWGQPAELKVRPSTENVRYYSTLPFRESPFADLIGLHPVSPENRDGQNAYRFEYDDKGRPVRIVFVLRDVPRSRNEHTGNFFAQAVRIDIEYQAGLEIRQFFDRHGNPALQRGAYREVYQLDDRGYRRALTFEDAHGAKIENSWGIARYTWSIEPDGTVIEDHFDLSGSPVPKRPNLPFMRLRLHYGPKGFLALMENYGTENRLVNNSLGAAQDKLEYEADGDMRAWNVFDENKNRVQGNSPGVARGIRDFDARGYIERSYYEDELGAPMRSAYGWGLTTNSYDTYGNLIERWSGDEVGKPAINERVGYHGFVHEWDETGRMLLKTRFFGTDRTTPARHTASGAHEFRYTYDEHENLKAISYHDENGGLTERADRGFARIEYSYDTSHRIIEIRRLDANERLLDIAAERWAVERRTYDSFGQVSKTSRFDAKMRPLEPMS